MRDLSGRRQRDINNEKRLQDYVAKQVLTVPNTVMKILLVRQALMNLRHQAARLEVRWDLFSQTGCRELEQSSQPTWSAL